MIAEWMLYCLSCACGLSIAAIVAERLLIPGRAPVRLVWIGAVVLSLALPVVAYRVASRPAADIAQNSAAVAQSRGAMVDGPPASETPIDAVTLMPKAAERRNWHALFASYDKALVIMWCTLSFVLALNFAGGIIVLASMRRTWRRQTVLGTEVWVSTQTGPAVVGARDPAIVIPEWVLAIAPSQLALLLKHEEEHRRARDGQLLTCARIALIIMPWNAALWWQILRLRVAVELDCDARVLQGEDARSYGDLLLRVASASRTANLTGATAFVERATQLERRIRVLARHRVPTSNVARLLAAIIGFATVTAATFAPRPDAISITVVAEAQTPEPRASQAPVVHNDTLVVDATTHPMSAKSDSSVSNSLSDTTSAAAQRARYQQAQLRIPRRVANDTQAVTSERAATDTGPRTVNVTIDIEATLADSAFERLFDGIDLSKTQRARAHEILEKLVAQQSSEPFVRLLADNIRKRTELLSRRDSSLLALLTTDADRAEFSRRVFQTAAGGRGRIGGANSDSLSTVQGAGGRSGGGAAGGRGGGPGGATGGARGNSGQGGGRVGRGSSPEAIVSANDASFRRMFDGIALTTEQELRARTVIEKTQQEIFALVAPTVSFRINVASQTVVMSAVGELELMSLLAPGADLDKLRSRIVVPAR